MQLNLTINPVKEPGLLSTNLWPVLSFALLLGLYGLAISPALVWIGHEVGNGVRVLALLAAVLMAGSAIWRFGWPRNWLTWQAAALIILCAYGSRFTFNILQQLSASFALLGLYGFARGLGDMPEKLWRQGFIMAALGALAIPFALVPGTGAGFYLRLLTADVSAGLLAVLGHASYGAHDVLIFDNGIAQVDIPCSGLKSLFTGTAFFLAASLILRRPVSIKWVVAYGLFILILLWANIMRVTVLIWLSEVMQMRDIAESLHTAIGLSLFALSCIAGIFLLRYLAPNMAVTSQPTKVPDHFAFSGIGIGFVAILLLVWPQKDVIWDAAIKTPGFISAQSVALTPTEENFFEARGQTTARKWTFSFGEVSGSMLVVKSRAANGLHAPEVCLMGNGLRVSDMQSQAWPQTAQKTTQETTNSRFRWLSINEGDYSAAYWMQSGDLVTDDFRKRLSEYVMGRHNQWIMVTLLFDQGLSADTLQTEKADAAKLMQQLQTFYSE